MHFPLQLRTLNIKKCMIFKNKTVFFLYGKEKFNLHSTNANTLSGYTALDALLDPHLNPTTNYVP